MLILKRRGWVPDTTNPTNLLTLNQSSVESGTSGFASSANVTLSRDGTKAAHGNSSMKAVRTSTTDDGIQTDNISATAGLDYCASAEIYAEVGQQFNIILVWYNATPAYISGSSATFTVTAGTWTRIAVNGTAPAGTAFVALKLRPVTAGTQTFNADKLFISRGSSPGRWVPGQTRRIRRRLIL
jgi:hypothetical protein